MRIPDHQTCTIWLCVLFQSKGVWNSVHSNQKSQKASYNILKYNPCLGVGEIPAQADEWALVGSGTDVEVEILQEDLDHTWRSRSSQRCPGWLRCELLWRSLEHQQVAYKLYCDCTVTTSDILNCLLPCTRLYMVLIAVPLCCIKE